ncbi:MAG: hypothetical protein WAN51_13120 [Alphaproteobacteria bacterium]
MIYANDADKVSVLTTVYKDLQEQIRDETRGNQITVTLVTAFFVIAGFSLQYDLTAKLSSHAKLLIIAFCALVSILTIWFLHKNNLRLRFETRSVVRIEKILRLYTPHIFVTTDEQKKHDKAVHNAENLKMPDRIYDEEAAGWAADGERRYALLHMLGVCIGLAAVILSLYIECPHCSNGESGSGKQGEMQINDWRLG